MRTLLLILITAIGQVALGQQLEDGKQLIRDYLHSMSAYKNADPSKVYYLDMTMETYYRPEAEIEDTRVDVKVLIAGERVQYESQYISYYMDNKESFTVIHPQRTILYGDGGGKNTVDKYASILAMNDTLFKYSKVSAYEDKVEAGKKVKRVVLTTDAVFKAKTGVEKVEYLYDVKEARVLKAVTTYSSKVQKKREVVTYNSLNYDYKSTPFKSASEKVLASNGRLLSKFQAYELIDNRNFLNK